MKKIAYHKNKIKNGARERNYEDYYASTKLERVLKYS